MQLDVRVQVGNLFVFVFSVNILSFPGNHSRHAAQLDEIEAEIDAETAEWAIQEARAGGAA